MGGPGWWNVSLLALVGLASVGCLVHLAGAHGRGRRAVAGADLAMGVAMTAVLAGVPVGRAVALTGAVGFTALAVASAAVPVAVGREVALGARRAVLCGAMAVMLLPLALVAGDHHGAAMPAMPATGAAGAPGVVVAAALAAVAVVTVLAADVVALSRHVAGGVRGERWPTACRVAMAAASVVMLVELVR